MTSEQVRSIPVNGKGEDKESGKTNCQMCGKTDKIGYVPVCPKCFDKWEALERENEKQRENITTMMKKVLDIEGLNLTINEKDAQIKRLTEEINGLHLEIDWYDERMKDDEEFIKEAIPEGVKGKIIETKLKKEIKRLTEDYKKLGEEFAESCNNVTKKNEKIKRLEEDMENQHGIGYSEGFNAASAAAKKYAKEFEKRCREEVTAAIREGVKNVWAFTDADEMFKQKVLALIDNSVKKAEVGVESEKPPMTLSQKRNGGEVPESVCGNANGRSGIPVNSSGTPKPEKCYCRHKKEDHDEKGWCSECECGSYRPKLMEPYVIMKKKQPKGVV